MGVVRNNHQVENFLPEDEDTILHAKDKGRGIGDLPALYAYRAIKQGWREKFQQYEDQWIKYDQAGADKFVQLIPGMTRETLAIHIDAIRREYIPGLTRILQALEEENTARAGAVVTPEQEGK